MSERLDQRHPDAYSAKGVNGGVNIQLSGEELKAFLHEYFLNNNQAAPDDNGQSAPVAQTKREVFTPPIRDENESYDEDYEDLSYGNIAVDENKVQQRRSFTPDQIGLPHVNAMTYGEVPALRLPKIRTIGLTTLALSMAAAPLGAFYPDEVKNPQMAIAQLPFINAGFTPEEDALLANCTDGEIGNLVYQANIDAVQPDPLPDTGKLMLVQAGMEWNVPNEDGTVGPPLTKTILDKADHDDNPDTPDKKVVPRYPEIFIGQTTGYVGVCDEEGNPAIRIVDAESDTPEVKINLSRLNLQLVLERQEGTVEAEDIPALKDFDGTGISKEIAAKLHASMLDIANVDIAAANALHVANQMMAAPGSTTSEQIKTETVESLPSTIKQLLAEQQPGATYAIEFEGETQDVEPVGTAEVATDKFQLVETALAPEITITNIAEPQV